MAEVNRHIDVEGGYNVRDLGGYPTAEGGVTRVHVLVRAGTAVWHFAVSWSRFAPGPQVNHGG